MTDKQTRKLLLIYKFILLDENHIKLFDEISGKEKTKLGRDFTSYSNKENEDFLRKWKNENHIRLTDFITVEERKYYKTDKNGVPIFIERKAQDDIERKN